MRKLLSAALLAGVGLAATTINRPAHAGAFVGVSVPVPAIAVAAPPAIAYAPAYVYAGPRVFYPRHRAYGYWHVRYGYRGGYVAGHAGWHGR